MSNSLYPNYIDMFSMKHDETGQNDGDFVMADDINSVQNAIVAIQSALGTNPQGSALSVAKRLQGIEQTQALSVPRITIFNGDPKLINGAADAESAARCFSYFNHVILSGIQASPGIMLNARDVIEKSKACGSTAFYGMIDAGVFTSNFTIETVNVMIEKWAEIGVTGIYFENFGYDKGVTRQRQNSLLRAVHNKGLMVIASVNNVDDLFSIENISGRNPDFEQSEMSAKDAMFIKSFGLTTSGYQSLPSIKTIEKAIGYRKTLGCKIFAIGYIDDNNVNDAQKKYYYGQALAMLYSLDAYHAMHTAQAIRTADFYNVLPLVGSYYDTNPVIKETTGTLSRRLAIGALTVDTTAHQYGFDNIKIPLRFIDMDGDDTKISIDKIDNSIEVNLIADINNYTGTDKIESSKIDFVGSGNQLIESINLVAANIAPKIDAKAIGTLNSANINQIVVEALKENLDDLLMSGQYSANLQNLTANWISSVNAYFQNVMMENAEIEGLDAGVLRSGYIKSGLIAADSITSDKLTIHANSGVNKWAGVIVKKVDGTVIPNPTPSMVIGKDVFRQVEQKDDSVISATVAIGTFETNYLVMWETSVFCTEPFTLNSRVFNATSPASLYINNVLKATSNGAGVAYNLVLNQGWNKIQVVQDHSAQASCEFNIGTKLSTYALQTENGTPTGIARVDAYVDKVTQITGDYIKTGSIEAKHIDVQDLKAEIVDAGLITAMEAYIDKLVATDGSFESLLADFIKSDLIDTKKITVRSEGVDSNGDPGLILIDNGGMIVSSRPRIEIEEADRALTLSSSDTYSSPHIDWVYDTANLPAIKLKDKITGEILSIEDGWYAVKYKDGKVIVDRAKLAALGVTDLSLFNVIATYKYYDSNWPNDAQLIKIDRNGIWISANGGGTWTQKITGAGIRITGSAEINEGIITTAHILDAQITNAKITDLEASKIEAGTIDLSKGINVFAQGGHTSLTDDGLLVQDSIVNPQKMVKVNRNGISITNNGGGMWTSKLTGDGLIVTSAEIVDLKAEKISTGTLQASTSIAVGNGVTISGSNGIIVDGSTNAGIEIKEGKLQVTEAGAPRVVVGKYNATNYGIQLLTSDQAITLDKNGLTAAKFKIKTDGTIEATDGSFAGTISSKSGSFGDTNKILVDSDGLVLNTGSIVDTRNVANQKLKIDANGIVAKKGYIGGLEIDTAINGISAKIDILGQQVEQFKLSPNTITLSGSEALTINTGNAVIKDNGNTYMTIGRISDGVYGTKINLANSDGSISARYIQLDQNGLRAYDGTKNTIDINKDGNVTISGTINALDGTLGELDVENTLTITGANGKIVAGTNEFTSSGVKVDQGTIGGWTIDADKIHKGATEINASTEQIKTTGVIIGKYDGTNYGIKATQGEIAGWSMANGVLSKGPTEINSTTEQIKTSGVVIGLYATDKRGIKAESGIIGGWSLSTNSLSSTNIVLDSTAELIGIKDQVQIGRYDATPGAEKYGVKAGTVVLNGAGLSGTGFSLGSSGVTATSGTIGGWSISTSELSSGNIHLDKQNNAIWIGATLPTAKIRFNSNGTGEIGLVGLNKVVDSITYPIHTPNFTIDSSGNVKMQGKIEATSGWFGTDEANAITVDGSGLKAGNVVINKSGLSLTTATGGTIVLNNNGFYITENGNAASSINFNNKFVANKDGITAIAGSIANWKIADNQIYTGASAIDFNISIDAAGNKIQIKDQVTMGEYDTGVYGIKAGNTVLNATGIQADQGTVGGWTLSPDSISKNGIVLDSANGKITIANDKIVLNSNGSATLGKLSIAADGAVASGTAFKLNADGTAEFSGKITASSGAIAGWDIAASTLSKNNVILDSAGSITIGQTAGSQVILHKDNGITVSDKFAVTLAGAMTASNANITGTVNATAGYIGTKTGGTLNGVAINSDGLEVKGTGLIKNGNTEISNNKVVIKNGTTPVVTFGEYATGKIGLSGTGFVLDSTGLTLTGTGTNGININNAFTVNSLGVLTATGATISGAITATSGAIGGWTVSSTEIKAASDRIKLNKDGTIFLGTGGSISIGSNMEVVDTGIVSYENKAAFLANTNRNRIVLDSTGLKIITGTSSDTVKSAITSAGIHGQLLTAQSVPGSAFDNITPNAPTNIQVTSAIEVLATGQFVNMTVSWTAPTTNTTGTAYDDAAGYKVYLSTDNGATYYPEVIVPATSTSCVIRNVKPNFAYKVAVTAFDKTGNESTRLVTANAITTVKDTQAPDKVTGLSVIDGLLAFTLRWNRLTGANNNDIDYYEIQSSIDAGATWLPVGKVYTDFITVRGLEYDKSYSFRVRAVDTSGNPSSATAGWSDVCLAGKPKQIGKEDIVAGTITAEELNIGSVVKSINAQQTTLFHFDGTLQSTQGLQPYVEVVDGQKVIHQQGFFKKEARFGASVSIEEDTENIIATVTGGNASLKSNTGGWTIGSGTFIPVNGVEGVDDGYIEVIYEGGAGNNRIDNIPVTPGKTYTISIYAKAVSANNPVVRVDINRVNGTAWEAETSPGRKKSIISAPTTLDWKRYTTTITIPEESGTTSVQLWFMGGNTGYVVGIDNVQMEERAYATSFINGTKSEGYVDYYAPAIMKRDEGTISFWMKNIIGWRNPTNNNHADTPTQDNLFIWGKPVSATDVTANSIYAKYDRATRVLSVKYNGTWITYTLPITTEQDAWLHFAFSWAAGQQKLYVNGVNVSTNTLAVMAEPEDKLFRLGYMPRLNGSAIVEEYVPEQVPGEKKARASCLFDELRIDKKAIVEDEIKSWYLQESSFYDASAQIDADSQNISAAAASVTINNEGITIRDGKLHVVSEDGQTLVTGGRLQVNGLDIGIAQSDNGLYNGNFTIGDTLYGPGDVRQSQKGIESWGAKYWRSRRSSGPTDYYVRNSLSWNRIWFAQYVGENTVKQAYEAVIRDKVVQGFQKTMNAYAQEATLAQIQINNPAASNPEKDTCKTIAGNTIDAYIDNPTMNTDTYINAALTPYGMTAYTPLIKGVVDALKGQAQLTPEFNVAAQVNANAPGTPQNVIDKCQLAARSAFNKFCADYDTNTDVEIQNELTASLPTVGIVNPVQIATFIGITQATLTAMHVPTKQSVETMIDDSVSNSFRMLNDWNCGYVTWNDIHGVRQFKVLHIMYPEEVAQYQEWHPTGTWVAGALYEITSPIVKDLIFGWPGTINIAENIDFVSGLPFIAEEPFKIGNTEYFVNVFGHYLGRVGYAELGVTGSRPEGEEVVIEQDTTKLIVYTDGFKPNGTHFKQHTASFNAVWAKDKEGRIIKSNSGKLFFDVEELLPKYTMDQNGMAKVLPSYVYNALPTEAQYNTSPTVLYWKARLDAVNPALFGLLTLEDKMILHNSTMMLDDMTPQQGFEIGNMSYDNSNPASYVLNSVKNVNTIIEWFTKGNGASYTHPVLGKTGKIYNKVCYFSLDDYSTQGQIDAAIAAHTPVITQTTVVGVENPDPDGNETVIGVGRKGDFVTIYFTSYSEVDAISTSFQNPLSGVYDAYIDGKHYTSGSLINSNSIFQNTDLSGIPAGSHSISFVSRHSRTGVEDYEGDDFNISLGQIRIFDWYNVRDVIAQIPDVVLPFAEKSKLYAKIATENTVEFTSEDAGVWTRVSIAPSVANSKTASGTPVFPERLPVKYKVRARLTKDATDSGMTTAYVTGMQVELGTNPSYARTVYGDESIPGAWIQSFNKELWLQSGIKTRHLEEHVPGFQRETGVYGRHMAEGTVTSTKIAYSSINDSHIADANITFRKTRVRKSKLVKQILSLTDYELEYGDDEMFNQYVSFIPTTPIPGSYYLPLAVEYDSEDVFENGQLLVPGDDYDIYKRIALIKADDMIEVAKILAIPVDPAQNELTPTQIQQLGAALMNVDAYTTTIGEQLKRDDVQLEYATQIVFKIVPDSTDTYVIKYWQEI